MSEERKHTWALSWPGNFCTTCGIDDPREECIAIDPTCQCLPGEDGKPVGVCKVKVPPCKLPVVGCPSDD